VKLRVFIGGNDRKWRILYRNGKKRVIRAISKHILREKAKMVSKTPKIDQNTILFD
jgi:hypothetical protein